MLQILPSHELCPTLSTKKRTCTIERSAQSSTPNCQVYERNAETQSTRSRVTTSINNTLVTLTCFKKMIYFIYFTSFSFFNCNLTAVKALTKVTIFFRELGIAVYICERITRQYKILVLDSVLKGVCM